MMAKAQDKEPTYKHFWLTMETEASEEAIWNLWTNVDDWHLWDIGLKKAEMRDSFKLSSIGIITSLEGRRSKFKVVEYVEGESYTFKTKLPLGSLFVKRFLNKEDGKTFFTHEVWFSGLTGGVFARQFGSDFMNMLPEVMENVKVLAEEN